MFLKRALKLKNINIKNGFSSRHVTYVQGQEPIRKIREYFYYIDHEGMLFLDDAKMKNFTSCFKEQKFLHFFFSRIKFNDTQRYQCEFPFMSLCGRERNYIRCDDTPIVYTNLLHSNSGCDMLSYGYAGDLLTIPFQPQMLYMNPNTGRVYHPAWEKVGNIGLIRSKLAIEMSRNFEFGNGEQNEPTHFMRHNERLQLKNDWVNTAARYGIGEHI